MIYHPIHVRLEAGCFTNQIYKRYDPFPLEVYNLGEETNKINAQCEQYSSTTKGGQKRALHGDYSDHGTGSILGKENVQDQKTPGTDTAQPVWQQKRWQLASPKLRQMEYGAGKRSRSQIKTGLGLYLVRQRPLFRVIILSSGRFYCPIGRRVS